MSDNVLSLTDVTKSFGSRTIMDGVTFGLDHGEKIGLIGPNGAGKSTLLRVIEGIEPVDDGIVAMRSGAKVHFLTQEPTFPKGATPRKVLSAFFDPLPVGMEEWEWPHLLERAATDVGLEDLDACIDHMSGGERKRVALAQMALSNADIILLDEPTNHVDSETTAWLEQWLAATSAAFLLVTHDRYFLECVVQRMAELRDGQLHLYEGAYTDYLEARTREEEHGANVRKRRLQLLRKELIWACRSPKARTGKSKARLQRVDALKEEQQRLQTEQGVARISFGKAPRLGKTILELVSVNKGYDGGPPLVRDLSLIVRKGERFGIIGPNGCGKTTLLRMLADQFSPDSGRIVRGKNTQIAYFDQHRSVLDLNMTVRETIVPDGGDYVVPGGGEKVHVASWLSRFSFDRQTHGMKVQSLSGGERNRLAIAKFLLQEANLLLLDEPTNDLDLITLNVLEEALVDFDGCVLVITHDRYFLDKVATAIIAFEPNEIAVVQGDYTHYKRVSKDRLDEQRRAEKATQAPAPKREAAANRPKRLGYMEQRELKALEAEIESVDELVTQLESAVNDPETWSGDHQKAAALDQEYKDAQKRSEELYLRWEELMEKAE